MKSGDIWLLVDSRGRGGIESHLCVLQRSLSDSGIGSRVVLLADHGPHPVFDANGSDGTLLRLAGPGSLPSALRHHRPSLVHTHGYKAGITGRLTARVMGVPVVSTFHSGDSGRGKVRLYSMIDRATARAAAVIAVSREIADGLPVDAEVIDNFVSLPESPQPVSNERPLTVGFVGRLSEEKGADLFCRVAENVPKADFIVFGDGPQREMLESRRTGRIRFDGMVSDMDRRWRDLDILCMPSRREGLPLAALEAMAHGVPVVAFGVGGLPDLIDHDGDGWIVRPGDVAALTATLHQLAMMPRSSIRAAGITARRKVERRYTAEATLPRILASYRRAGWNG